MREPFHTPWPSTWRNVLERINHLSGRRDGESAGNSGSEIKVGPLKEHPCVVHAIGTEFAIRECRYA